LKELMALFRLVILAAVATAAFVAGRRLRLPDLPTAPAQPTHSEAVPTLEAVQKLSSLVVSRVAVADLSQTRIDGYAGGITAVVVIHGDFLLGVDLAAARFASCDQKSRLVVMTSAGDPSSLAGKLIARARLEDRWYVSEMPGPLEWISAEDLAEQKAQLLDSEFARLHLNRWVATEDRLISLEDIEACVCLDGPQQPRGDLRYRIGVDLAVIRDNAWNAWPCSRRNTASVISGYIWTWAAWTMVNYAARWSVLPPA